MPLLKLKMCLLILITVLTTQNSEAQAQPTKREVAVKTWQAVGNSPEFIQAVEDFYQGSVGQNPKVTMQFVRNFCGTVARLITAQGVTMNTAQVYEGCLRKNEKGTLSASGFINIRQSLKYFEIARTSPTHFETLAESASIYLTHYNLIIRTIEAVVP